MADIYRPAALDPTADPLRNSPHSGDGLAIVNSVFFAGLVYFPIRRKPVAARLPSTAAIAMPVAFGDAIAMAFFKDFFPKLDPDASGMFAAFLLLTTAVILATGLFAGSRVARE